MTLTKNIMKELYQRALIQIKRLICFCLVLVSSCGHNVKSTIVVNNHMQVENEDRHLIEDKRFQLAYELFISIMSAYGFPEQEMRQKFQERDYTIVVKKDSFICPDKEIFCSGLHFYDDEKKRWTIWIVYDKFLGKTSLMHEFLHAVIDMSQNHDHPYVWQIACSSYFTNSQDVQICQQKTLENLLEVELLRYEQNLVKSGTKL